MAIQHTRFIHCADIHLDSCMETHLTALQAQNRRKELLQTFLRMVNYADQHQVRGILICGDLFDTGQISPSTFSALLHTIQEHPKLDFLYLPGNHDNLCLPSLLSDMDCPDNFWLLQTSDTIITPDFMPVSSISMYRESVTSPGTACRTEQSSLTAHTVAEKSYGPITITGLTDSISKLPPLSSSQTNIVMLHGQIDSSSFRRDDTCFHYSLKDLSGRNIDYAAAGHIHRYTSGRIDSRGVYCYSGCLEGRGFDECGEKGFIILDIATDEHNHLSNLDFQFVPFASRYFFDIKVDITDSASYPDIEQKVAAALSGIDSEHLVRLKLGGSISPELNLHLNWLFQQYSEDFYFLRIEDHTQPLLHYEDYRYDSSLKGEFIRLVLSDPDLKEDDKEKIILEGLRALSGEEILLSQ
ncbi:MAG: metallophosphoesterase [Lachnospiraceae bacterium]|nr:metallophosphoesterase [Lachnospiraceae bacterium]